MAQRLPRLPRRRARRHRPRRATPTTSTSTPRSSSACTSAGKQIVEVPIPTYYGDEICYVNGMKYAKDVIIDVLRFQARRMGFGTGRPAAGQRIDADAPTSSSRRRTPPTACCSRWIAAARRRPTVLDVGCSDGRFGALVRAAGPPRRPASTWSSTRASASGSTGSSRPTSTSACPPAPAALRRHRRRRRPRARRRPGAAAHEPRATASQPAARSSCRCRTSLTGTPAARSPSAASTTTSAARSTTATSASSPGAASSGSSTTCGLRDRRARRRRLAGRRARPRRRVARLAAARGAAPGRPGGDRASGRRCSATSSSTASRPAERSNGALNPARPGPPSRAPGPGASSPRASPGRSSAAWPSCSSCWTSGTDLGRTAVALRYASNFFDRRARVPRRPGRRAGGRHGHRGLHRGLEDLHVLRAVPGPAPDPGAARHAGLRRPADLVSMLLAWVVFAVITTRLVWLVRRPARRRRDAPVTKRQAVLAAVFLAGVTGGTTLTFDASLPWVYHEVYLGRPRSSSPRRTGWCARALEPDAAARGLARARRPVRRADPHHRRLGRLRGRDRAGPVDVARPLLHAARAGSRRGCWRPACCRSRSASPTTW